MIKTFERLPCGGSITRPGDAPGIYRITRHIGEAAKCVVFVLLHPPKLKRGQVDSELELALEYARQHGFGELCVLYLFPYIGLDLKEVKKREVPWGPGPVGYTIRDIEIHRAIDAQNGGLVIAAWGEDGDYMDRAAMFLRRFDGSPSCFGWSRKKVYPIHALSLTPAGKPGRPSATSIQASAPIPLFDMGKAVA